MNNTDYTKFVILGTARTGSSLLWSLLNSHPDILCLRGVFGSREKINFGDYYPYEEAESRTKSLLALRNNSPIEFLNTYIFREYDAPIQAVGFKYFYDHGRHLTHPEKVQEYLLNDIALKFIHIKRRNLLAGLHSYKRALIDNKWTLTTDNNLQDGNSPKIRIEPQECQDYFHRIQQQEAFFDGKIGDRTYSIYYESLIENTKGISQDILDYLRVKRQVLSSNFERINKAPLAGTIENYSELRSYFRNTRFSCYFE